MTFAGADGWGGSSLRTKSALLVRGVIEAGVLALVCLAPWAFGATSPRFEFFLDVGVAGLMALWALRILLDWRWNWQWCPVGACLFALVVVAALQMAPMPKGLLSLVSPATARMYDRLLPARPEVVQAGDPGDSLTVPAGSTLTFDRGVTRREVGRFLAIFALFAIVRANVDPAGGLGRLAVAALVNGSLLALFGIVQAFSSNPKTIYWFYPTAGDPFGPFINRNHFAFYVNVCVGLGIGLLLGRAGAVDGPGGKFGHGFGSWTRLANGFLRNPGTIGIAFALGLMISGVASSVSRGGFLALMGGLLFGLVAWLTQHRGRSLAGWTVLLGPTVALALVCWFGYDQLATRLATLRTGEVLQEQRSAIWARALPVVRDFPLWGTGGGTYEFADMLHRSDAEDADTVVDHAHNDYLELLVEGGLALLVPAVLALALTFRIGIRAARGLGNTPTAGLATGALVSLVAVAIHSFTDFGLHIPSCVALVVVLCSLLSGLGSDPRGSEGRAAGYGGMAPVLGAIAMLALGLLIAHEGWRPARVQEIKGQAADLDRSGDPSRLDRKVDLLEEAARLVPEDYAIREDLFSAHLNAFDQELYELTRGDPAGLAGSSGPRRQPTDADLARPRREHLVPALRHLQRSRDLCPFRAMVQMQLAEHVGDFQAADPRGAHLDRAKLLAPGDPELWYRCGAFELADGRTDQAWASWRHSLGLSGDRLPEILDQAARHLGPADLLERVLPEDPDRLIEAASRLSPGSVEGRRIFLESALALLDRGPGPSSAAEGHLRATLYRNLGRSTEALATYRSALALEPLRHQWRLELAELSAERGQFEESRQELLVILGLQPGNDRARILLDEVTRKIAEGK
jgi:O-antigen ligase/tetratricopeptide (TPR) repeat protein